MSFLRVPLLTLISNYLLLHLGFCNAYLNCLVALIKITTVYLQYYDKETEHKAVKKKWDTLVFVVL